MLEKIIGLVSEAMYSYILIILLVIGGLYFTFRTRGTQITMLGEQVRVVTEKPKDGKGVSSFHALMVSTASRVGTGNIIGVSTAICLGGFGPVFITVAMILFAFTTLLGNLYYVNQAFSHILGRTPSKKFNYVYYVLASLVIFVGAGLSAGLLWDIADITMGLMTLINMPVIVYLGKYAFRALSDYKRKKKSGISPEFHARDIGIDCELDYWN